LTTQPKIVIMVTQIISAAPLLTSAFAAAILAG
jgi:hypothetical protein